ncbi:hypothetical protein, partial [uncultured Senegalimassilia sp.]|uniref:hypothetical protein n=1 Tax=uncultured Senegalimassilia sp. TaxID=1714350 RepID=UPI0025E42F36
MSGTVVVGIAPRPFFAMEADIGGHHCPAQSAEDVAQYVTDSKSSFGRGGMTSKCNTALSVAHTGIH